MPSFSRRSFDRLMTCDPTLREVLNEAITIYDFSVLCGQRGEEEQNRAYADGKSQLRWPNSRHNLDPSRAVDIAPYPIDWEDLSRFYYMATVVLAVAARKRIPVVWGGHWQMKDHPHFEVV